MKLKPKITIFDHFSEIEDPRVERTKQHKLIDIITIAICAVICGAEGWTDIETYGLAKYEWLKQFLELPNNIPSHDTFSRVFSRLNPQQFQQGFLNWIKSISKIIPAEVIAIDGKSLRHSYEQRAGLGALHIVSAWATENRLVLGQVKVDKKSNEITAIPELIKVLELSGCIVTIDAMGCQQEIVKLIAEQEAEYIISLKKNQGALYKNVEELFKSAIRTGFSGIEHSAFQTREQAHGREETRHYLMLTDIAERVDPSHKWPQLKSIGLVESVRTVDGKTSVETRYYISSLSNNAEIFCQSVRSHWGVENSLHWILDVALNEDNCRIRTDNAPENFAVMRRLAVNLLGQENSNKRGVKNKQFLAAMDNEYLTKVLTAA